MTQAWVIFNIILPDTGKWEEKMSEFKIIESQEELDKILKDRLDRAEKKAKEELQGLIDSLKSENAGLKEENTNYQKQLEGIEEKDKTISNLEGEIESYKMAELRRKVAIENNIPYKIADRIIGDDEESMTEDAKRLAEFVGKKDYVPPLKTYEDKDSDSTQGAYKTLLSNLNTKGE
jgi:hypothetical protein